MAGNVVQRMMVAITLEEAANLPEQVLGMPPTL